MADGLLHEMRRGATIERMADVGMSEPMRRDVEREPRAQNSGFHDTMDRRSIEAAASPCPPA